MAFDRLAHEQRFADALHAEQRHLAAPLRQHPHQAFARQPLKRLAYGCAADAEALGRGGLDLESENGLVVPAGTPADIVRRLHQEIVRIMRDPAIADPLIAQGYEIVANTPAEFGATVRSDVQKYAALIQRLGLKVD